MKWISAAIFSFGVTVLALTFALQDPVAWGQGLEHPDSFALAPVRRVETSAAPDARPDSAEQEVLIRHLTRDEREPLARARRALQVAQLQRQKASELRRKASTDREVAAAAFEGAYLELNAAEQALDELRETRNKRAIARAEAQVKEARHSALAAERRLREVLRVLGRAESALDRASSDARDARAEIERIEREVEHTQEIVRSLTLEQASELTLTLEAAARRAQPLDLDASHLLGMLKGEYEASQVRALAWAHRSRRPRSLASRPR